MGRGGPSAGPLAAGPSRPIAAAFTPVPPPVREGPPLPAPSHLPALHPLWPTLSPRQPPHPAHTQLPHFAPEFHLVREEFELGPSVALLSLALSRDPHRPPPRRPKVRRRAHRQTGPPAYLAAARTPADGEIVVVGRAPPSYYDGLPSYAASKR